MTKFLFLLIFLLQSVCFLLFFIYPPETLASGSCTAIVSPSSVQTSTDTNFSFSITNTGLNTVTTIKIIRPSTNFRLENLGVSGWSVNADSEFAELTGGTVTGGSTVNINYHGVSGADEAPSANWTVQTNDGSGLVSCTGTLGTAISGVRDTVAPTMNDVTVTGIYATQANVTWTTNESATSRVEYSVTSDDYNLSKEGPLATSHNIALTGLTANTTYYAVAYSSDVSGNTTSTEEFTFTTAASDAGVATTVTVNTTTTTTTTNTETRVTTPAPDTVGPSITIKTDLSNAFEQSPEISGTVSDNSRVIKLEYSIDGGVNWSPLETDGLGEKSITFIFTPNILDDGDYKLIVRAVDGAGNKAQSKPKSIIIDRLPPKIGPIVIMAGPIIIESDSGGYTNLLAGVEYKIIVSFAGGPNKVNLKCGDFSTDLTQNPDNGFWFAKLNFKDSFDCQINFTAEDGAGNELNVDNQKLRVNDFGKFDGGNITVYWYDDLIKKFVVWDGLTFGQVNPIDTTITKGYGLMLPRGKYYLRLRVGLKTYVSNVLDINETSYINDDIIIPKFNIFKFWSNEVIINPKVMSIKSWKDTNFVFPDVNLGEFSAFNTRGKTSVVGLFSSWHPLSGEYLKQLVDLDENDITVFPILLQEKEAVAKFMQRRGGYDLKIYADKDGEILTDINLNGVPTTWIVNRFGQVAKEKVGEISYQEVMDEINTLD